MGDDSGLKIQETGVLFGVEEKQCRAAARKTLPSLISSCLQSILEGAGESGATEVQDFPIALRQAPWEQGGSQPVRGAAMHYKTGWRYRLTSRNRQPEEKRLSIFFSIP